MLKKKIVLILVLTAAAVLAAGCYTPEIPETTPTATPTTGTPGTTPAPTTVATTTAIPNVSTAGCAVHLHDGDNASMTRRENIRGVRYGEISLICGANASMYNTDNLNNEVDPNNTVPEELWDNISEEAMAEQYEVPSVWKNGPRFWVNDWINIPIGKELDFNGLKARWYAYPKYPPNVQELGITAGAYITTTVERRTQMGFVKGQPVFILDDPNGTPWVMQAASMEVDPNLTYEDLMTLDTKLELPPGWSYRVKVLDQDLTIQAINGFANITQDSLGNSYNACYALNGTATCSYQP